MRRCAEQTKWEQPLSDRENGQRIQIGTATALAGDILAKLEGTGGLENLAVAGGLRRFEETVTTIDFIATAEDAREAINAFLSLPKVSEVHGTNENRAGVTISGGVRANLFLVPEDCFGSGLQSFTGSELHNVKLAERALQEGLRISECGISDIRTGRAEKFATEEAFYDRLGLQYIPPEIREGEREIEKAAKGEIPELLKLSDMRGELHVHTDWSDGKNTIEEMVLAAKARGYEYIGIADHSYGGRIARGEGYTEQRREIELLNRKIEGIHILSGGEVNVMPDGNLEIPDEMLSQMDFVIAAVHHKLDMPRNQMLKRIIKAMENPYVHILAHPTSRRVIPIPEPVEYGPIDVDMEALFEAALETDTALEIDSMPSRLDLNDAHARRARELGVKLIIDTDSHRTANLEYLRFGVSIARRAWCKPTDIVNTKPIEELLALLKLKKGAGKV